MYSPYQIYIYFCAVNYKFKNKTHNEKDFINCYGWHRPHGFYVLHS